MCMFNRCLCFRDFGRFITAVGIFQLAASTFELILTISVFAGVNQIMPIMFGPNTMPLLDQQLSSMVNMNIYALYIVLAVMDAFMILFAMLLLCGNEEMDAGRGRTCYYPWLILFPFYAIFETAINIYFFVMVLSPPGSAGFVVAWGVGPLVYWALKHLFLGGSYYMIISHICGCCHPAVHMAEPVSVATHTSPVYMTSAAVSSGCQPCHQPQKPCHTGACQPQAVMQPVVYGGYAAGNARSGWVSSVYNNGRNW